MARRDRFVFNRSSLRSNSSRYTGSQTSSFSDLDARERVKDCCRKIIAFLCTHIGVGGLVVCYTIVGALSFPELEKHQDNSTQRLIHTIKSNYSKVLFAIAAEKNEFDEEAFIDGMDAALLKYQEKIVDLVRGGYKGPKTADWTFPAALMFCLSTITMIGYGNLAPKTTWGKIATVLYAIIGIPLFVLYFLNMGAALSGGFRTVYIWLYRYSTERNRDEASTKRIVVPSTASLWVLIGYIFAGAILFWKWERWSYLDSVYFCFTSICKIGFGDLVFGADYEADSKAGNYGKLVVNFVYVLGGLSLVAMCYHLMRDQVRAKVKEISEDLNQCLEDTKIRCTGFYKKCKKKDSIV